MIHAVWRIAVDEGFLSLYRGVIARMLFHIPMTAISMSVVEQLKPQIVKYIDSTK